MGNYISCHHYQHDTHGAIVLVRLFSQTTARHVSNEPDSRLQRQRYSVGGPISFSGSHVLVTGMFYKNYVNPELQKNITVRSVMNNMNNMNNMVYDFVCRR
jgi:hypothetical protein